MFSRFMTGTATAAMIALGTPALAQAPEQLVLAGFIDEVGGAERIDFSGKLRMLSQRIPATACNIAGGIATEDASAMLAGAADEFDRIITALEHGDEGLGIIGAEVDRKVLTDVALVHEIWDPMYVELQAMLASTVTVENAADIAQRSHDLLDIAKHLVVMIRDEYADPTALLQADAIVIDIAGRQRMLAQRISKNACLVASGIVPEAAVAEMSGAMETYAVSMMALRDGLPEAGISGPPTAEIAAGMDDVVNEWAAIQPALEAIKAGQTVSGEQRADVFHAMNRLTGKMNTLVGLYTAASKLGL